METRHVKDMLPEYLDGTLDSTRKNVVAEHLKGCVSCLSEMEQLKILFQAFEVEEKELPGRRIKDDFYRFLDQQTEQKRGIPSITRRPWIPTLLKTAAGVAMLIGSFFLGKLQQERQSDQTIRALVLQSSDIKQTAMLSLMENRSASKRIQGVNYMEEFSDPDDLIMEALVRRMLFDENNNVRLAAVNALQPFNNLAPVTSAYIKALETEKDPRIQLALIRILVSIREKNAIPPMRQLLEDSQTETFVKDHIKSLLPTIV